MLGLISRNRTVPWRSRSLQVGARNSATSDSTSPEERVVNRVLDAPRELVYRAFTGSAQLARWFGPVSLSVPRESVDIDARVGGHQRLTTVNGDDPSLTSVNATFTEVVEIELLVGNEKVEGIPERREPSRCPCGPSSTTRTARLDR